MADRAKKISELQITTSVAPTDKIVVLKDAANASIAATKAMSVNSFALSITSMVQTPIPNTTFVANSVTVQSNGVTPVPFFVYDIGAGKTGCCHIEYHARDVYDNSISGGFISIVVLGSDANVGYTGATLGANPIGFDINPVVNTTANTITVLFYRGSATSTNVNIRYSATIF